MAALTIATFNCAGMADNVRRTALFHYFKKLPCQLILLQETHSKIENEPIWTAEWAPGAAIFNSTMNAKIAGNGVAVLINDNSLHITATKKDNEGRIIAVDVSTQNYVFHLVNVYAPATGFQNKNSFFDNMYMFVTSNLPTIIAGDFNSLDQPAIDRFPPGSPAEINKSLTSLCKVFSLTDAFRHLYGDTRAFTRRQGTSQARLDRFYVSKEFQPTAQTSRPHALSDHDLVLLQISNISTPPRGPGTWQNNTRVYQTEDFQTELSTRWNKWQTLHPTLFVNKINWWTHIKTRIKEMNQKYSRLLACERQREEISLEQQLQELWNRIPDEPNLIPEYYAIKKKLAAIQLRNIKQKLYKSKQINIGNQALGTKEFFAQFTTNRKNTTINALANAQGNIVTDKEELLEVAHEFYQRLYNANPTDQSAIDHFLQYTPRRSPADDQETDQFQKPFTEAEVHEIVKRMPHGKTPGPDGISAEFYKKCWHVIGQDLTETINAMHTSAHIPKDMKTGIIKLIHKKGTTTELKNYRPITLLNVDLKIYTKLLTNRLLLLIEHIISPQQYAVAGRNIYQAVTLLRDLHYHATSKKLDAFFIALDFHKAFDSINHNYLLQTLQRMGLPTQLYQTIASLNSEATSQISINGFLTHPIELQRGVRQGDPLSMILFLIAAEPLATTIQHHNDIRGIKIPGKHEIFSCRYADDMTLTLQNLSSVETAFKQVRHFEHACGLRINMQKTNGLLCSSDITRLVNLPAIPWNHKSLTLLGSVIGTPAAITQEWNRILTNFKMETKKLSSYILTHNAKALLTKSKLMPILTYTAHIYPLAVSHRKEITTKIENFMAGDPRLTLPIKVLALPLNQGGYRLQHIVLYCDLLALKPVSLYCLHRKNNTELTPELAFIEYNIGLQLSHFLSIPVKNHLPHAETPNPFYSFSLALCRKYHLTFQDLCSFQTRTIYNIHTVNRHNTDKTTPGTHWPCIHHPILPNTLKTFNYRAVWNTLPIMTKLYPPQPDGPTLCTFCHLHQETPAHLFFECVTVQPIWKYITNLTQRTTRLSLTPSNDLCAKFNLPKSAIPFTDQLTLLYTITRHTIWKLRNAARFENKNVNFGMMIKRIQQALRYRYTYEKRKTKSIHENTLRQLCAAL